MCTRVCVDIKAGGRHLPGLPSTRSSQLNPEPIMDVSSQLAPGTLPLPSGVTTIIALPGLYVVLGIRILLFFLSWRALVTSGSHWLPQGEHWLPNHFPSFVFVFFFNLGGKDVGMSNLGPVQVGRSNCFPKVMGATLNASSTG